MLTRWQGLTGAVVVTLGTVALVLLDLTDPGVRLWWLSHALTTDTVSGMLVVLLTVLVVDQVVRRRQILDRARAISAQAGIVGAQASRVGPGRERRAERLGRPRSRPAARSGPT